MTATTGSHAAPLCGGAAQAMASTGAARDPQGSAPLIPIVVGVTGHRDARDNADGDLIRCVCAVLDHVKDEHPDRPLLLITPLAEGADRLVARVALEKGASLVVPLPFEVADYESDFESDESREEFRRLLAHERTVRWFEMPAIELPGTSLPWETLRSLQYALVGAWIAHSSDIVIALWDGVESEKVGGTSHVVSYRRCGRFPIDAALAEVLAELPEPFAVRERFLDAPDVGVVYHVVTPRKTQPDPPDAYTWGPLVPWVYEPKDKYEAYQERLRALHENIVAFNRDAEACHARDRAALERSASSLCPSTAPLPRSLAPLRDAFAVADVLAIRHQRKVYRTLAALFVLVGVAFAAFVVHAHGLEPGEPGRGVLLLVYVAVLAGADAYYLLSRYRRGQDKFQDYRAVAEGLRVQFYWRLAGLPHDAFDYYLRKQRDELTWIPHAVRAYAVGVPVAPDGDLRAVRDLWIEGRDGHEGQRQYFEKAGSRERARSRRRLLGSGCAGVSIALAVASLRPYAHEFPGWGNQVGRACVGLAVLIFAAHAVVELAGLLGGEGRQRWGDRLRDLAMLLVGVGAAAAVSRVLVMLPHWLPRFEGWVLAGPLEWMLVALGVTGAASALIHGYVEKRALSEHMRQYARMLEIFTNARDRIDELLEKGEHRRAGALVFELGQEALAEHGDWVLLHRERPIEVPEAGG